MLPRTALPKDHRAQYSRLRLLLREPGLMRGTLVEMRRSCGKPSCRCRTDPAARHGALYLALSLNGKHRTVYIPVEWETRVREWVARYAEVRQLLEQISLGFLGRLKKRER
ncbi:MAG TPA: DUF6788 family protein [Candidatus Polarisedimenticolia bacterium]|jgi:hypothetical protein|nr:DUF6788 family protein [Candidatus Polarisedimenticolia bacterium]